MATEEYKTFRMARELPFKRMREGAIMPTRGSAHSAGYDLYACIDDVNVVIPPHHTKMIPVGFGTEIPEGYFGAIVARSSLAAKENLRVEQGMACIDSDYRGEIFVPIHNDEGHFPRTIYPNQRIAQMIVMPYLFFVWKEVDELSETERGEGGFGSTGKF